MQQMHNPQLFTPFMACKGLAGGSQNAKPFQLPWLQTCFVHPFEFYISKAKHRTLMSIKAKVLGRARKGKVQPTKGQRPS